MKHMLFVIALFIQTIAVAQFVPPQENPRQVEQEAISMSQEVLATLRRGNLNYRDLVAVRDELLDVISVIRNGAVLDPVGSLLCLKAGNGRYYPTNPETGRVVGSEEWKAGHDLLVDCQRTLPSRNARIACFKTGNGRYYPTNPKTGEVIGSSEWKAGFDLLNDCLRAIGLEN